MKRPVLLTSCAHCLPKLTIVAVFVVRGFLNFMDPEDFAVILPISNAETVLVTTVESLGLLMLAYTTFYRKRFKNPFSVNLDSEQR
ncbi:MAG: hypothetical protein COA52_13720 [Hyphomicrobiales bacterium]|nr:hypothetical protein [Hyphomicrobiales bacterium]PCJ87893.1 MAG: hypothetical protein COA52_13720 [Hyphomicrobiales bacterium]